MRLRTDPAQAANIGYAYRTPSSGWAARVRHVLVQFSDYFSEFNRYIAPAYHHDRCERSVQMRLYTMHKRELMVVILTFVACVFLAVLVGLCGPPITAQSEIRATSLRPSLSPQELASASTPMVLRTPALKSYHQQLWLIAKLQTDNVDDELYDRAVHIGVTAHGIMEDHRPVLILKADRGHNRTRHLHCKLQDCEEVVIMHLGFLAYTHYMVEIRFYGLESHTFNVKEITFYFRTYNPEFTQIEIWFRLIFLIMTFVAMMMYAHALRKFPSHDWSIEQRWLSLLLPLLVFFNDPIFPLMFLTSSWVPGMLDAVLQATFLCALLLFWLCIYHGLRQNERRWGSFYAPKLLLVGLLWLGAVVMASWQKCNELHDPTFNHRVDAADYNGYKAFLMAVGGLYAVYLLFLMLRAYTDLRSMPFFDMRLRFLTFFMMVVIGVTLTLAGMRYGAGVLEDDFVSELSTTYTSSAHFMCFYGLLNFYTFAMAYVYSPAQMQPHDQALTKDNPAFSMINESDEEQVLYGSDDECRRPLNLSRCNEADDSD
ncbi:transmembrane protein 181 [Thrips palmi]|uniref:Transmembrane protein 181 n=1 Tax=Thrips palmi TaxID=161013 RepID=A0A6P8Z256_THRPL|nr:transmembrane protein 181 [Thrips palmi]